MRTVTFADPTLRKLLRKDYVCAYTNIEGEDNAGSSFAHGPKDHVGSCIRGNGEQNVQMLMATPDGQLLNVTSGFIDAKDLIEELTFAKTLANLPEEEMAAAQKKFAEELDQREWNGRMGEWEKRRALQDHRFAAQRPLLALSKFKPEDLVGSGHSFFGTSVNKVWLKKAAGIRPRDWPKGLIDGEKEKNKE